MSVSTRPEAVWRARAAAPLVAVAKATLAPETRRLVRHVAYCLRHRGHVVAALGASGYRAFLVRPLWAELGRRLRGRRAAPTYTLTSPLARFPLHVRVRSSDMDVFRQIFVEGEYGCLAHVRDARVVIDCGANVGMASAWFLSAFPAARLVAVEPDGRNVAMLRRNLAPYGDRAAVVEGAVWATRAPLALVPGVFGDGREWATQVRACDADEAQLMGVDMPTLVAMAGGATVDVLKIDIEGAEAELFAGPTDWLRTVTEMVIEIHGDAIARTVHAAIPPGEFSVQQSGELTHFHRIRAAETAAR